MNFIVIGAGGVGSFYGVILKMQGHNVKFVVRGKNLEYFKNNKLKLTHPNFTFEEYIDVLDINELKQLDINNIDAVFLATKSMSTEEICKDLALWSKDREKLPYFISLQNGVENEDKMLKYLKQEYVIGGLTRLIAAHIVKQGLVDAVGEVQTILGALVPTNENKLFLNKLKEQLDKTGTTTILTDNIRLELWKKLIINNGVNAICALLEEKSGTLINNEKTSILVYNLMKEAALASNAVGVNISENDAKEMFELMKSFESIVPSMWVDKQNNRDLELEDICGVVIKNCKKQGIDAAYTRSVSTILEVLYNKSRA
ncbi:ketopantoate reductase [Malaciobacter mytili LMG 24559]|uniref:2-dehydropantoate 2-reductase n=1 Tax=Malaciobacter mytili LMG 24559 TaxID=1032238 RepID=A0AAX2AE03_9BACT|nr:2-dehydropantoate 2-reductase [Malaciobacter mytili]AXH13915.1 2-dehydropantoate 2-reductase [Malaciobacter mytili LMG 24559]RXK14815.1 ketopantoate reductase [Malaciobacter mytili LMG 24559]